MQGALEKLVDQNAKQAEQIGELIEQNKLLQQKVEFLLSRLFGKKSEKLDRNQLELLLAGMDPDAGPADDPPPSTPPPRSRKKRERKPRLPEDLPTENQIIDPEAVKQDPSAYRCIGEEVTEELDVVPTRYFRRRIIRRKYVSKTKRSQAPLLAPLPPRLIEGGYASAGLLTDIMLKKYVDHLPLNRQEQILRTRHGIDLSRKTMSDWVRVVADWLRPIYDHIQEELRDSAYLQVDETPVRYCQKEGGGSGQGYLWVYNEPGRNVLYDWHPSRAATCLDGMLDTFSGTVQCDGYRAYASYVKTRPDIELAACWAHVRRKFNDARESEPLLAGWFLNQIGCLYGVEREIRGRAPALRAAARASSSAMIMARLELALKRKLGQHRPSTAIENAIRYTLSLWPQLIRFLEDGLIEIDNNGVENAIRPTAVGKKNYLFFGDPKAGQRSAIVYTLVECCKRYGINPQEYLLDVLTRLPSMKITQVAALTPAAWAEQRRQSQAA